jgi:hypothetical protein
MCRLLSRASSLFAGASLVFLVLSGSLLDRFSARAEEPLTTGCVQSGACANPAGPCFSSGVCFNPGCGCAINDEEDCWCAA